jgi:hypothetical protein
LDCSRYGKPKTKNEPERRTNNRNQKPKTENQEPKTRWETSSLSSPLLPASNDEILSEPRLHPACFTESPHWLPLPSP